MPILLQCPRCRQPLSVADKMAGASVLCPYCNGRLSVPPAPGGPPGIDPPAPGLPRLTPPPSPPSPISPPSPPPGSGTLPVQPPLPQMTPMAASPSPTPTAPAPQHRVARFIAAEAARSPLSLTADGKLPELHLAEVAASGAKPAKVSGLHPLVLFALICLSLVASVMLVMVDVSPPSAGHSATKWRARQVIEEEYFSSLDSPEPRQRYQILLRDAQRAYARGDYEAQRTCYTKALDLLRTERGPFDTVTGTASRDKRLEEQIIILLSKD